MDIPVFENLREKELISESEFEKIKTAVQTQPVSVHWDLRTILYAGILLLVSGLGIIIYKNIDTIGHDVMVGIIALCCTACFFYCIKKSKGYSGKKIESPNVWFDYILLSGCLLLLTLVGYLQFQYTLFGNRWGLAIFIPMVLLFISAYYFDHLGVLSLAITNLAAWAGITITPLQILNSNNFSNARVIFTGIALGILLISLSWFSIRKNIKSHFAFTYKNFGAHLLYISLIAALFEFEDIYLVVFLVFTAVAFFFYKNAIKENSFYFLVITFLYSYIAAGYIVVNMFDIIGDGIITLYFSLFYFIGSGIMLIRLLMYYNKKLKANDSLQQNRPV